MKIYLRFDNIKPITLNHATKYRSQGRFVKSYKSKEYKHLESVINSQINNNQNKKEISRFNKKFDENKHCLDVEYICHYPIKLKKKEKISKKSMDLSNIEKNLQDCIFKHLLADDSCITSLHSHKIHSDICYIEVSIKINFL